MSKPPLSPRPSSAENASGVDRPIAAPNAIVVAEPLFDLPERLPEFGIAVVVVYTGATGDAQKDLVLTKARAAVIRRYLVGNFGFDDTQLKTLG